MAPRPGILEKSWYGFAHLPCIVGPVPTGDLIGALRAGFRWGGRFSILTRKVEPRGLTGDRVRVGPAQPVALGGSSSWIRWFSRKPLVASGASCSNAHAPLRLPMAFHVQTVLSFSAAICATGTVIVAVRRGDARPVAILKPVFASAWSADRAGCGRGSGAATRSASPRSDTSPSGAGSARGRVFLVRLSRTARYQIGSGSMLL